jgi:hypothetical protein
VGGFGGRDRGGDEIMARKSKAKRTTRQTKISRKIRLLIREGKKPDQASAIAHSMARRGEL